MPTLSECHDRIQNWGAAITIEQSTAYVNEAGERMVGLYPWRYLEGGRATLNEVAGQDYLQLPDDFGEIIGEPVPSEYGVDRFKLVDAERFERRAQTGIDYDGCTYGTLIEVPVNGEMVTRIEVYPVPATSQSAKWTLRYRARWTRVDDDNSNLVLARECEALFWGILNAVALGHEEHDEGTVEQRMADVGRWSSFRSATRADARRNRRRGALPNGIHGRNMARRVHGGDWPLHHNGPVNL